METKYKFEDIPLDRLELDNQNPRLPKSLKGCSEAEIIHFMLLDASLIELMLAIGKNGYFPGEQLLVTPIENSSKLRVIEGNRRLTAVKLLNQPELATIQKGKVSKVIAETSERPTEIPCLIFKNEAEIHNYLGYRHITGIKEWKLTEKARYLYSIYEQNYSGVSLNDASREIAKSIGSRQDYVRRVLVGFEVFKTIEDEAFYKIPGLDDTTFYFNYIVDSLNRSQIASFLGVDFANDEPIEALNTDNLSKWTHWLFEKNDQNKTRLIGNSSDLNDLNKVLSNEQALTAFDSGVSLSKSLELTGEIDKNFENSIIKAIEYLERADTLVLKVNDFYSNYDDDIKTIQLIAKKIKRSIEDKIDLEEL